MKMKTTTQGTNLHGYILTVALILACASLPLLLLADSQDSGGSGGSCGTPFDNDCDGEVTFDASCAGNTCSAYDLDDNDPDVGNFDDYVAGGGELLPPS